jgi:hypothetical protein
MIVYSTRRGPSKKRRYYYIPAVQEMRDRYNAILDDFGEGEELDKFVKEQQDLVPQILEVPFTSDYPLLFLFIEAMNRPRKHLLVGGTTILANDLGRTMRLGGNEPQSEYRLPAHQDPT